MMIKKCNKLIYPVLLFTALFTAVNFCMLRSFLSRDVDTSVSSTQTMYADSYPETKEFPDLFLRNLVKGKKIKVARRIKTYDEYETFGHDEDEGNPFDKHYLIDNDYTRWFGLYAGEVEVDEDLPVGDETERIFGALKQDFFDAGEANDMLRYSFPLNREKVQQASAFWYSWYYNAFSEKVKKNKDKDMQPNIYVNLDGAEDADTLVAVWTDREDLYLMSGEKYGELKGRQH